MGSDRESQFIKVHQDSYPLIYAFVQRRVNDHETSQELTADVFRIVWQKWEGEKPHIAWLYSIARNVIGNEYRSRERQHRLHHRLREAAELPPPDPESTSWVQDVLDSLRESDREILQLAYWESLSVTELGTVLEITPGAAKVRLHRARKAFRQAMSAIAATHSLQQREA